MARHPPNLRSYCSYWLSVSSWHGADMPSQHALPPRRPARRLGADVAAYRQMTVKVGGLINAIF